MNEQSKYRDKRSEFWRRIFERARGYEDYLDDSEPTHAGKWRDMARNLSELDKSDVERLSAHARQMKVLVYSGIWCGDCVRQGPMLRQIARAAGDHVDLRFVERDASEELREELRVLGALRVPIVVFLSEDFHELGRFGDRMLTVYRAKAKRELGEACSSGLFAPPEAELAAERGEWLDIFERMLLMLRLSPPLRARHGD